MPSPCRRAACKIGDAEGGAVREKLEVRLQLRPGSLAPRKEEVGRMIDEALRVVRSAAG